MNEPIFQGPLKGRPAIIVWGVFGALLTGLFVFARFVGKEVDLASEHLHNAAKVYEANFEQVGSEAAGKIAQKQFPDIDVYASCGGANFVNRYGRDLIIMGRNCFDEDEKRFEKISQLLSINAHLDDHDVAQLLIKQVPGLTSVNVECPTIEVITVNEQRRVYRRPCPQPSLQAK